MSAHAAMDLAPGPAADAAAFDPASDAIAAAALLAIDPLGLGGVALRGPADPARDAWLNLLRRLLPAGSPWRRVPLNLGDAALIGGLDFAATLQCGRPVAQTGVLAQADGGFALLAMAERTSAHTAARIAAVMDAREVALQRDGIAQRHDARVALVLLDEGCDDDEQAPPALLDRVAFRIPMDAMRSCIELAQWPGLDGDRIALLREQLSAVRADDACLHSLCAVAHALGVDSMRAPLLALRAARAAAALDGRDVVSPDDVTLAARLVLAPRATRLPQAEPPADSDTDTPEPPAEAQRPPEPPQSDPPDDASEEPLNQQQVQELADQVLEAAQAAIPDGLLKLLQMGQAQRSRTHSGGRAGAQQKSLMRGRPVGSRRGEPRGGARLHVLDTLRAAAPWQRIRAQTSDPSTPRRIHVRRDDFHVRRYRQHTGTTAIFLVDASGSAALHRLAEAKGAVELLLADCYVRRDKVAVLAFRGKQAEVLLAPTRSLARAKRSLAGLPGGGGTPLAAGLDAAREMAHAVQRGGDSAVLVVLTDGRANVARDGSPGRERAAEDALSAARELHLLGVKSLLLDTAPQPQASAQALAQGMGAAYLPLPHADARAMSQAVRLATGRG